jgi:hypothetical protein
VQLLYQGTYDNIKNPNKDSHIATKGGAITVGNKRHVPVVKVRIEQPAIAEKSESKLSRQWPSLRRTEVCFTSLYTCIFVIAPATSLHVDDPLGGTTARACV